MACTLVCGCNNKGPARVPVAGHITVGGEPLQNGSIAFEPVGHGIAGGGTIKDGSYDISKLSGPTAGKSLVRIVSPNPRGRTTIDKMSGQTITLLDETIAARYNTQSELTVELPVGGNLALDFKLDPK